MKNIISYIFLFIILIIFIIKNISYKEGFGKKLKKGFKKGVKTVGKAAKSAGKAIKKAAEKAKPPRPKLPPKIKRLYKETKKKVYIPTKNIAIPKIPNPPTPEIPNPPTPEITNPVEDFSRIKENFSSEYTYDYGSKVLPPNEAGITKKGKGNKIPKNIERQAKYLNIVFGGDMSNVTGKAQLGGKFFYNTNLKCKDENTDEEKDRYIYIDNAPPGAEDGLIAGAMHTLKQFDISEIESVFLEPSKPKCRQITMPVRDNNNVTSDETQYVSINDIGNINACSFPSNYNEVSECQCDEECDKSKFRIDLGLEKLAEGIYS